MGLVSIRIPFVNLLYNKIFILTFALVKRWKTIRIVGITLTILLLLGIIILSVGDHLLNRYLNNKGIEAINEALPINGKLSYDHISIHPFRDFPNISLKINGLQIADSLVTEHKQTPVVVEGLYLNASLKSLRKKHLEIKSVELDGLILNIYDRADGYSNIASLIQTKINNATKSKTKDGWTVEFDYAQLNIRDIQLNKIDEVTQQKAHFFIDELDVKSAATDSAYHLTLAIEKLKVSPNPDKNWAQIPVQLKKGKAEVLLDQSFSTASLVNVQVSDGKIDLQKDAQGLSNFLDLVGSTKPTSSKNSNGITVELDGADIKMNDIDFAIVDQSKNKHLEGRIIELTTELNLNPDTSAIIDLHLDVNQLAINTKKGAFLSNSIVQGQVKTNYANRSIAFSSPELSINKDTFNVQSYLSFDRRSPTTLTIKKAEALTFKIRPLLTQDLQNKITTYDVKGPITAKAHIVFTPGVKKARVDLDMKVQNQTVVVKGHVITNAEVSATLINGLYDDQLQYREDKKNVRLLIHHVSGKINDFQIDSENALITSTPDEGVRLIANADVTGKAATASQFLEHDRFSFQEGAFLMSTNIDASLDNLDNLIAGTDFNLEMKDMKVIYPAGNTSLPLTSLTMNKDGDTTVFKIEGLAVGAGSPIYIQGEVEHLSSVLFPEQEEQLRTQAKIRANSISWGGLIALFGKDGIVSAAQQDSTQLSKQSMKQTLTGIQESFRPTIEVTIDTVHYGEKAQLLNFKTGLNFKEDRTLVLQKTSFQIEESNITLDGEVVINQLDFTKFDFDIALQHLDLDVLLPKFNYFGVHLMKQIHDQPDDLTMHIQLSGELDDIAGLKPESIDANITYESFAENKFTGSLALKANPSTKKVDVVFGHSGFPKNINDLLGSKEYIFDKGWFTISFEFDDNFESIAQMVEESKIGLTIADAEVFITELGVTVPLSRIEVSAIDNDAYYHMLIKSDSLNQELALDGVVKNIRHFAFNDTEAPYEVDLSISSPRIVWDHLKQIVAYGDSRSQQSGKTIKASLTKILRDFNPNVKLAVDKLVYSDQLSFNDIYAHAYMENDILKVDSANVAYGDSHIQANIDMDMAHESILPFTLNLGLINIDIAETLAYFDYFKREELRSAKQIDGNVWLELDMAGEINLENNGYDYAKTDAELKVVVQDLVVADLETINSITERMRSKKRFKVLRFAPIDTHIKIQGTNIKIEKTEIQSNALQVFVEGTIGKKSPENLWISVPIQNLKKPDLDTIPDHTGYAASGRKIFLQWVTSESKDDGKTKVWLNKRKFFQERIQGIKFRAHKRANRKERRRLRQESRSN